MNVSNWIGIQLWQLNKKWNKLSFDVMYAIFNWLAIASCYRRWTIPWGGFKSSDIGRYAELLIWAEDDSPLDVMG